MSKDIERAYILAIKRNFEDINTNQIDAGKGFINIANLFNNAEKNGYKLDYIELAKKYFRTFNKKTIKQEYLKDCDTLTEVVEKLLDIARNHPEQAKNIWDEYVLKIKVANNIELPEAEKAAKKNIGYFMGYFDAEKRDLIYKTYNLNHPIFKEIIEY